MSDHSHDTLNEKNVFFKRYITAGFSETPTMRGQVTVTWPSSDGETLFGLSEDKFVIAFTELMEVAVKLQRLQDVKRVGLVSDGGSSLHLIPLHGAVEPTPIGTKDKKKDEKEKKEKKEKRFNSHYLGYVRSGSGPRAASDDLNEIRDKIRDEFRDDLNYEFRNEPRAKIREELQDRVFNKHFEGSSKDLFARIVRGEEREQWRVWEDKGYVAFLTPSPGTPGFTVLVPRKQVTSNLFQLGLPDFQNLMCATHKVAQVLKKAMGIDHVGLLFQRLSRDYAHVKLVPRPPDSRFQDHSPSHATFSEEYPGYITSQPGPPISYSLARDTQLMTEMFE